MTLAPVVVGTRNETRLRPLRAYFGHHKCASAWIQAILRSACKAATLHGVTVHNPTMFAGDLPTFVDRENVDVLCYDNARWSDCRTLAELRGFHVIRDPRDILVSAYFSHRFSHPTRNWPELEEHRRALQQATKEEGMLLDLAFNRDVFEAIETWNYDRPNILEVKMEDLITNPYAEFVQIFSFLHLLKEEDSKSQIPNSKRLESNACLPVDQAGNLESPHIGITQDELLDLVRQFRYENLTGGRAEGERDDRHHYRRGVPGDWRNHFTPKITNIFKEGYNDLIVALGYEATRDW